MPSSYNGNKRESQHKRPPLLPRVRLTRRHRENADFQRLQSLQLAELARAMYIGLTYKQMFEQREEIARLSLLHARPRRHSTISDVYWAAREIAGMDQYEDIADDDGMDDGINEDF